MIVEFQESQLQDSIQTSPQGFEGHIQLEMLTSQCDKFGEEMGILDFL